MAEMVEQLWGQSFGNGTAAQVWLFTGFEDAAAVDGRLKQFLPDEVPLVWAGLPIDTNWDVKELGGGAWSVGVKFSARAGNILDPTADETAEHPDHGGEEGADQEVAANISFSVRTGTQKITQSLATLDKACVDGADKARNFGQAIAVKDGAGGEVEGFEAFVGEPTWTLKGKIPGFLVTGAYVKKIQSLLCPRPRMNLKPFFGYKQGEVLIVQADVSELTSNGFRDVAFQFAVKFDQAELKLSAAPELSLLNVNGWSVVWCTYKMQTQTIDGVSRQALLPYEAYEERIYDYGDFDELAIKRFKKKTVTTP